MNWINRFTTHKVKPQLNYLAFAPKQPDFFFFKVVLINSSSSLRGTYLHFFLNSGCFFTQFMFSPCIWPWYCNVQSWEENKKIKNKQGKQRSGGQKTASGFKQTKNRKRNSIKNLKDKSSFRRSLTVRQFFN